MTKQCTTYGCRRISIHVLDVVGVVCSRCYIALTTPFMHPEDCTAMTEGEFIEYVRSSRERSRETVAV